MVIIVDVLVPKSEVFDGVLNVYLVQGISSIVNGPVILELLPGRTNIADFMFYPILDIYGTFVKWS